MTRVRISRRSVLAMAGAGATLALPAWAQEQSQTNPIDTTTGQVRGLRGGGVSAFRGVPYGGDTALVRFQPAVPPAPWTNVRDCFAYGAVAPQGQTGSGARLAGMNQARLAALMRIFQTSAANPNVPQSEDCLSLNVYTPDASPSRRRPVMVWLHGGAFAIGSGRETLYEGSNLARRGDVVVVTLNHRLNALGYLYLGAIHNDFADSGNVGTLDQILALQWVRDNIAQFGGDPRNVTIFGQSGGGGKVTTLLGSPAAQGLFHKAIVQSGARLRGVERAEAEETASRTLAALGVAPADVHLLQRMSRERVIAAAQGNLSPLVDGRTLPAHPFDPAATPLVRNIPVMVGCTKDESASSFSTDPAFDTMTADQARERFVSALGERGNAAFEIYRARRPNDRPTYWFTSLTGERGAWMNSIRLAERKAAQGGAPVYLYRMDWETPVMDGIYRAPHGIDLPMIFDNTSLVPELVGEGERPARLAAIMSQAWVNFARTGNPSQSGLAWPRYDARQRRTMLFNDESRVVADPDSGVREFFAAQA